MIDRYMHDEQAKLGAALAALTALLPHLNDESQGGTVRAARLAEAAAHGKEIWRATATMAEFETIKREGAARVAARKGVRQWRR